MIKFLQDESWATRTSLRTSAERQAVTHLAEVVPGLLNVVISISSAAGEAQWQIP